MSDREFGVGFVGAGFIASTMHLPSFEYVPDANITGILNPTRSKAEAFAAECRATGAGDPAVYDEGQLVDLVHDQNVDGIWVTSPNYTRLETIETVVEAVKDGARLDGIALEKPVARTLAESEEVATLVREVEIPTAYLENYVHDPEIAGMKERLWERGRPAGRPYIARSQAEHAGPHAAWFWDGRRQGGGALTDMLCHALAGNEFILTDPEADGTDLTPVSISADVETLKWDQPEYAEQLREEYNIDYETAPTDDYARVTVTYETDEGRRVVSEATGSWCFVGSGVRRRIELLGPEYSGQVVTDETASSVFFSDELDEGEGWAEKQTATSGRMPVAGELVDGAMLAENHDAVEAFRRGENGFLDIEDGLAVMELCMAGYRAAETGAAVDPRVVDLSGYVPPSARE
ncbi:Gfo/Idh/MocA family oxidoreductase (plasmid) [Halococcus dombrowskii]|uniref:Gfo/Idh/MocA family oxidoreductase n=1 Tax=Halococcus dombrowskii TaxID=179637 RepID=A0AAV3SIF9_HALDO|nr:Gfo/Idh/MocA family oxidoreductase [Halococcus dombrowskii]UOO97264.1 Gfo/Idh/MocA family oxidoreductase [Halococcus dombrowskii]